MTVLREQRQPHDCPAEERQVYTPCPNVLMTQGSVIVEDFATASFTRQCIMLFRFLILTHLFLTAENREQVVHPTPQTSL